MIALLQRVSEASVRVNDEDGERQTGAIGKGLLVLLGVERGDSTVESDRLLERVIAYRVFADAEDRMNLNLEQAGGELLVVSQFTLAADTSKGNRPSFSRAADPESGNTLYEHFVATARQRLGACATGEFGAAMKVRLVNDGPVTFQLRVAPANTTS